MKKKILIRIGSLRHGGAEKVLVTLLKNLPPDKYEIDLLLNLYSGKYLKEVPAWISVFYLNKGEMITTNRLQDIPRKAWRVIYQWFLRSNPKLLYRFILKNKKYDIEIAANQAMSDEILNSPLKSSKKIVWIHSDLIHSTSPKNQSEILRRFFKFDKILTISEQINNDFINAAQSKKELARIQMICNPIDTNEILEKSRIPFDGQLYPPAIPLFISIGTVYPAKGFDRLVNVHKRLLAENLRHQILIIGDGYNFENLRKQVFALHLQNTVKFLGFVDNPYPYLKRADFFVLSSRYEGFPTVLYEAITLKKNIIATDVSGVREMLADGKLGLMVENSDEGIYSGMKQALVSPSKFDFYQRQLHDYQMPFSLENSVLKIETILESL